jgi:hypothetical protein
LVGHSNASLGKGHYNGSVLPDEIRNATPINGTSGPQNPCAASWLAWGNARRKWESDNPSTRDYALGEMTSTVVGILSSYTLCDGIPRIRLASTATESWKSSITVPMFLSTAATAEHATITPFSMPSPSCRLDPLECKNEWHRLFKRVDISPDLDPIWAAGLSAPEAMPQQKFFGCAPPEEICRSPVATLQRDLSATHRPDGGCTIEAGRVALIYFPEKIQSSDLCANNGLGHYVTAPTPITSRKPSLFSTSEVVLHSHNFYYPGVDFGANDGMAIDPHPHVGDSNTESILQDLHTTSLSRDRRPSHLQLQAFTWVRIANQPLSRLLIN